MIVSAANAVDGVLRVHVDGEIDMLTVDELDVALTDAIAAGPAERIIVDFGSVAFCDSSGIAAVDRAYYRAGERGIRLQVVNLQPSVRRVFELVGVLDQLTQP